MVPVDDMEVKTKLREHGQPACECDSDDMLYKCTPYFVIVVLNY